MMYYHMIEEIEQKRQEYIAERGKLLKEETFGHPLNIANTKIYICATALSTC